MVEPTWNHPYPSIVTFTHCYNPWIKLLDWNISIALIFCPMKNLKNGSFIHGKIWKYKTLQELLATFSFSLFKKKSAFYGPSEWKYLWYKSKVVYHMKFLFWSGGVGFFIQCILNYAQHNLVDFWKTWLANFNFIWLEWNSYDSRIQFHVKILIEVACLT